MRRRKGVLEKKLATGCETRSDFLLDSGGFHRREEELALLRVGLELGLRLLASRSKFGKVAGRGSKVGAIAIAFGSKGAMFIDTPQRNKRT
jgi:hypothetical protein